MGVLDRIGILIKAQFKERIDAEDPEKIMDLSINDMRESLARFHQTLAQLMADLNLHEQQYNQSVTQAQEWEKRAILAIRKGEENLAREVLSRKKTHDDSVATLKAGLDDNLRRVELLKKIIEMQIELVQLRQTLEQSIATLKHKEAEHNQCTLQLQEWDQRSLLALQNDDENLANENLSQKQKYVSLAETLKSELDLQLMQIDTLKKNFISIKRKIVDARAIECNFPTRVPRQKYELCFTDAPRQNDVEYEIDPELAALKAKIMESCSSDSSASIE